MARPRFEPGTSYLPARNTPKTVGVYLLPSNSVHQAIGNVQNTGNLTMHMSVRQKVTMLSIISTAKNMKYNSYVTLING